MGALKLVYDMIPKWLLMILVVALAVLSGWCWTKMKYYQVEYKSVKADNVTLTKNVDTLTKDLDICNKGLTAEADNCKRLLKIKDEACQEQQEICDICVKENPNAKTDIKDAVIMYNKSGKSWNDSLPPR